MSPASVGSGDSSTLTITLSNSGPTAVTGVTFTDTLPARMTQYYLPPGTTCGGSVSQSAVTSVSLSGGTIPANGTCTVTTLVWVSQKRG